MSNQEPPTRPPLRRASLTLTAPAAGYMAATIAAVHPFGLIPVPVLGGTWDGVAAGVVFVLPTLLTLKKRGLPLTFGWYLLFFTIAAN